MAEGEQEDESQKTEEPTERRLSKAREDGDVPISQEVKNFSVVLGALFIVWLILPFVMKKFKIFGTKYIEHSDSITISSDNIRGIAASISLDIGLILAIPLAIMFLLGLAASLGQIGFLFTPKKISELKWERLNVFSQLKNFITMQKIIETIKGLLKITLVFIAIFIVTYPKLKDLPFMIDMEAIAILLILHKMIVWLLFAVLIIMCVLAIIDFIYTRFEYNKKLKMTIKQIKDEYKESEGDPLIKSKIRSIRMERYRNNMMKNVKDASVIITNPDHYAVALLYKMGTMNAPKVVAKGVDFMAQKIKEIARENDVPIVENPPLARALYAAVEIDREIPEEHYQAVAEVIKYVMELKQETIS